MFLDGGRKPEYPERTHAYTGRTCRLHTERTSRELNLEPSRCEATVLTTTPPCSPHNICQVKIKSDLLTSALLSVQMCTMLCIRRSKAKETIFLHSRRHQSCWDQKKKNTRCLIMRNGEIYRDLLWSHLVHISLIRQVELLALLSHPAELSCSPIKYKASLTRSELDCSDGWGSDSQQVGGLILGLSRSKCSWARSSIPSTTLEKYHEVILWEKASTICEMMLQGQGTLCAGEGLIMSFHLNFYSSLAKTFQQPVKQMKLR